MRFLGEKEQYLAVATNSALVKVFQREDLSCQLLSGHTAVVLSLDGSSDGRRMVTGSKVSWGRVEGQLRVMGQLSVFMIVAQVISTMFSVLRVAWLPQDNTIRLWQLSDNGHFSCVAVGYGHTHSIGAVAFSRYIQLCVTISAALYQAMWNCFCSTLVCGVSVCSRVYPSLSLSLSAR